MITDNFKDVFKTIVDEVRKEYDPTNNLKPYLQFGLYSDLIEVLKIKDNNQIGKYPLIWLVWENSNNQQRWIDPYVYSISPRVFICDLATQDDNSDERYDNVISPILNPLFDLFIQEMKYCPYIEFPALNPYRLNDLPVGQLSSDSGTFDFISAKEINFQDLLIYKN